MNANKFAISVLGYDRPGIIAAVSEILLEHRCNIEDVSQTILQTEFVGAFIASRPDHVSEERVAAGLREKLEPLGLSVLVKPMMQGDEWVPPRSEPFVITTVGPDRKGLVAGITRVLANFGINISSLKAVFRGGDDPSHNVMIYEVDIPADVDQNAFRKVLHERADELGLDISLQHRDIFETIYRI